jgi:hypothetical protein
MNIFTALTVKWIVIIGATYAARKAIEKMAPS